MQKDFDSWNKIKKKLEQTHSIPTFKEREIWWCHVGANLGYETIGKGKEFWRPILIIDKHNIHTFFGLPLSTTIKPHSHYHFPIDFNGKKGSVLLSQGRTFSSKRLSNIMGSIPDPILEDIINAYKNSF